MTGLSFIRRIWFNGPSGATPITADELNRIEDGIVDHDNAIDSLDSEIAGKAPLDSPALTGAPTVNGLPLVGGGGSGTVTSVGATDATITVNNADPANPTVKVTAGTFDAAGAATTAATAAQTAAQSYADTNKLAKSANLSDVANAATSLANLGGQTTDGSIVLAAPTGTSADDTVLAAAITAATASGKKIVARAGIYGITSHQVIPNLVDLVGQGGGSTSVAGRTTFKCLNAAAQIEFDGGGGLSGGFEVDGNSTATTPFFRNGGTGANARTFHNITVHHNAVSGTNSNDLSLFYGAQNDYYFQCGFGYADRDAMVFDQGFGGVTFERIEVTGSIGRYWHRYDNLIAGGVSPYPFNIIWKGTTNLEGGSASSVSHVKVNAGVDITYDKTWFYSAVALTGPSVDVATGGIINLVNPSFQSSPSTKTAGTKAIAVAGTGRVTIVGRAQYLNFDKPINIDGLSAHIFDNTPPEFYNCTSPSFTGTSSATSAQWENDSNGLRTVTGNATDIVSIGYTPTKSGLWFEDLGDGSRKYFPGTGFAGSSVEWGPRNSTTAVGVPLSSTVPVCLGGGTTAQRPAAVAGLAGATWINTDVGAYEWCNGSAWLTDPRGLPSYAAALNLLGSWSRDNSTYNAGSGTVHAHRAAVAKVVNGDADLHVFFVGDSFIGQGYNGASYSYENSLQRAFGKALAEAVGVPFTSGIQMAVADSASAVADNVTIGTWTADVSLQAVKSTANAQTLTGVALPDVGTSVDVFYWDDGLTGCTWKIDGVSQTAISTAGTHTIQKVTVSGLSNAAHTLAFTSVGSGHKIVGWRSYNPSIKSVQVHGLALGGSCANTSPSAHNYLNWSDTTSTGSPFGLGYMMAQLVSASGITPNLTVLSLGANDASQGTAAATILTGVQNVLGYALTGANRVWLKCWKPTAGTSDSIWDTFSGSLFTQSDTTGFPILDVDDLTGRRTVANTDGLVGADGTHPTIAAMKLLARRLALPFVGLLARFETVHLVESPLTSGTYPVRPAVAICPAGYAHYIGHDTPGDWVDGDPWDQTP